MSKRFLLLASIVSATPLVWFACTAPNASPRPEAVVAVAQFENDFRTSVHPFIQTYCVECHGGPLPEAELDLSVYTSLDSITRDLPRWEQVLERIETGEMPPSDAPRHPTDAERHPVVAWLGAVHAAEAQRTAGDPGIVLARRLSNAEYDYTIRDLTGVDLRPTREFPVDPANEAGFDNSGESLAMSPALVQKYLDAARLVSEHLVFTPDGFTFAPYPATTNQDRDKFAVLRIVDFYRAQGPAIGGRYDNYMAQSLDYADFFVAAWRFQHRGALGREKAQLADFAAEAKVSPKYLATLWSTLTTPGGEVGPLAALQARWEKFPVPVAGKEPGNVRAEAVALREFIQGVRSLVRMDFSNLVPHDRIVAAGSQTMVLWKNRQYANHRTTYSGKAQAADFAKFIETDPALKVPEADDARAAYEEAFKRFCAVFPDAFYVAERARMFLGNQRDIDSDLRGHRWLTAGFHSQMGFFRDDKPLYDLVLDEAQQRELDRLWRELDFITQAPFRQFQEFIFFERGEPPSLMVSPAFAAFRAEDADLISEAKLKQLAEVYHVRAENTVVHVPVMRPGARVGTPLNYIAPEPGAVTGPPPPEQVEFRLSETALQAIRDYFVEMNAKIRALESAQRAAEPRHLEALIAFADRAVRRPLSEAERKDLLAFYRTLRAEDLSHEDAIRDCVVSVLMSPSFSYRFALPHLAGGEAAPAVQPLSGYELASRLSYFLWSSMPDAELRAHAAAGDLHQPEVLAAQVRRMLRDDRVQALATEFAGNWLDIRRFEEHNAVDRERFPTFTNELRQAMFEEPVRFTTDLIQRNGSILDFIYGQHTFVNPALAAHYDMPVPADAAADDWVRVDNAAAYQRGGLLPMAAFLTKHAPGLRTSPVKRGHWVVVRLLGERIPPPPPDIPELPTDESKMGDLTLREMLARHREDKSCASCLDKIDSFGLVFEGFGPVGEVRATDLAGRPTETSAVFPDGSEGTGLAGLQHYIRTNAADDFVDNISRKLMVYALGRSLIPSDNLVIKDLGRKLTADGFRFDTLVEGIVTSPQFLTKRVSPNPEGN